MRLLLGPGPELDDVSQDRRRDEGTHLPPLFLDIDLDVPDRAAEHLADDAGLRHEGRKEERKGEAKEELERDQERADRKAEEVANLERKT